MVELIEEMHPAPLTTFEMKRTRDESGLSLEACDNDSNTVLEGVVYTDGTVSIHWRSRYWSVVFYPDWKTFVNVHIGSHPTNGTVIDFVRRDGSSYRWKQEDEQRSLQSDARAIVNGVIADLNSEAKRRSYTGFPTSGPIGGLAQARGMDD